MPGDASPVDHPSFETMTIKLRIGTLLFDLLLDGSFYPHRVVSGPSQHNHVAYELHFFVGGSGTMFADGREIAIRSPSVHLIGPHVYHAFTAENADPLTRFYLQFAFAETNSRDDCSLPPSEALQIKEALERIGYLLFDDPEPLLLLTEQIKAQFASPLLGYYTQIRSLFMQLIVLIARTIRPAAESYALSAKIQDDLRTRVIEMYLDEYRRNLTLEELADRLHMSAKQTNRVMRKYYGVSFKQKLLDLRIEAAKQILLTGDMSIRQIAEEVGYASERHFGALFARRTGITPTQFRKLAAANT
ncbi:helix-turn-helix transcriptional regulator [Paenibacillus cymbidii]|uniref:helix-turn-helix transcriptional regulator n=1 Tax=Paenibacillus cymbidii TaxID=1639034 RepID=UPI001080B3B2|nr:AraC family transcriptional regulator [Paenibacillus cymbidii]